MTYLASASPLGYALVDINFYLLNNHIISLLHLLSVSRHLRQVLSLLAGELLPLFPNPSEVRPTAASTPTLRTGTDGNQNVPVVDILTTSSPNAQTLKT